MKKQNFIESNIWVIVSNIIISSKGIILIPILIKSYGEGIYGSYVLLASVAMVIFQLSSFGIGYKYKRYMPSIVNKSRKQNLYYTQLVFHLISILFFLILFSYLSNDINNKLLKLNAKYEIIIFIAYIISILLFNQSSNYFRLTHRIKYYAIIQTLYPIISITLIYLFAQIDNNNTLNRILTIYTCVLLLLTFINNAKILKELGITIPKLKFRYIINDINYGYPLVIYYLIDFTLGSFDRFIISFFLGSIAVSYYNPAYLLGALILIIPKTFSVVLQPYLSKQYDENRRGFKLSHATKSIEIYLLFALPYVIGTIFFSKPILKLLTTQVIANNSYFITPIVSLGVLFFGLNNIYSTIYFVKRKTKSILYINGLSVVLNIAINIIFISIYKNILVAAISTFLSYFISFLIFNSSMRKTTKLKLDVKFISKIFISTLILLSYLILINLMINEMFILKLISSIIIYLTALVCLKTFKINKLLIQ